MSSASPGAEPIEGHVPVPGVCVWLTIVVAAWAGWYMGAYGGGGRAETYDIDSALPAPAESANPRIDKELLGRRVYGACAGCHQVDGAGIPGVYPPLAQSEWVTGDARRLTRIVAHGLRGRLVVRGQAYQQTMPAWRGLGHEKLSAVLTYVRTAWGNTGGEASEELVQGVLREGVRAPLTAGELAEEP